MGISTFTSKEFVIFCRVSKIGNANRQLPFALFDSGRRFPASVWMTLLVIRMVVKTRFGRQLVVWTTPKSMPRNGDCRSTLYIYMAFAVLWATYLFVKPRCLILEIPKKSVWCHIPIDNSSLLMFIMVLCRAFMVCDILAAEVSWQRGRDRAWFQFGSPFCGGRTWRERLPERSKLPHRLPGWDMVGYGSVAHSYPCHVAHGIGELMEGFHEILQNI